MAGKYRQNESRSCDGEALWKEFFRDPSQWWDNRNVKMNPSSPDFKHKGTRRCLWIGTSNPAWVKEELRRRPATVLDNRIVQKQDERTAVFSFKAEDSIFVGLLRAAAKKKDLSRGITIHVDVLKSGLLEKSSYLADALVSMYAKCGDLVRARALLYGLPFRNVVSWTALISGYTQHGQGEEALACFEEMQLEGISPNAVTFTCILTACSSIGAVDVGERIRDEITRQGLLEDNVVLGTALVHMYAKCGALAKAQEVLKELPALNIVSWSALIAGYTDQGKGDEALKCYDQMQQKGLPPNSVTFIAVLKACGSLKAAAKGEQIHEEIDKLGLLARNVVLGTAIVDMYAKCGALVKARHVLEGLPVRDVVAWNALIAGYAQQGQGLDVLQCFQSMQDDGICPDAVTFTCLLKACGCLRAADLGAEIHDEILGQGLLEKSVTLGTALVDMYAKCGALARAQRVLDELPIRDVVAWNALIAGYAQEGQGQDALDCLERMQHQGLLPNASTFTCILIACGNMGAVDKGEQIHDEITRQGLLGSHPALGNALVSMYTKFGALEKALQVLEALPVQDVVSWSAVVAGYAQKGHSKEALECFDLMQSKGLTPDALTFSSVLSACSHSGLVEEGQSIFSNMSTNFGIKPAIEHYTCMVNLFGHAGHLDKAVELIERMPSSDYSVIWAALLGACCKWDNVTVGQWAFKHAVQVDKNDAAPYICMAKLYAAAGMHEDAEIIEALRVRNTACKSSHMSGMHLESISIEKPHELEFRLF